ncbi:hypothetical protein BG000_012070 [Podila horticola]|nr:hypothetical protein BG000_012070 [Podila horticola]
MGPPVVAPLPSRRLGQGHLPGQGYTPTFNPHHIGDISQHGTLTGMRPPTFAPPPPPPIKRQDSDENQSGVLKVPPGYFPIFNGSEWVLISHAAASIAGIPIPVPQSSPSHNGKDGNVGSLSRASSPPTHTTLRRQASEIGHGAKQGTDMRRTDSESRRGSLPSSLSRTGSPSDFKSSRSPGSPNYHNESSTAVQENLDFLDLLQRYEYLSAWARQGKSKTPSETGSPIDGGAHKRLEPFEKSLVLKEITEWIEEHKDYLLREKQDLFLPSQIDFGNINPNAEKTIKTLRIENHGPRIVQIRPLQIIPNAYDQLGPLFKETLIVYPANGTEPMFANIDIGLKTGGFFSSWLLILVNESSLIGRKITWNVTNNTQIDREMDPYAKTYTPQRLRNLNTIKPRMVITGEQASTIDFGAYLEANDHPCYKKHNGKFSLEPPKVESLEVILPGQVSIDLSADSYASRFHPLLRVEQYLVNEDVSTYNLYMIDLKLADAASNYFQFQVNGLSEQCPMLLRGDSVIVRQVTGDVFSGIEYRTFVHGTNNRTNSVYVHLPMGALPSLAQERWNIQFKVSNSRIKEMYRAVGGIQEFLGYHPRDPAQETGEDDDSEFYSARTFLFPTIQDTKRKTKLPSINLGFVDATLNWEQKSAVQSIVRNDYGPIPFIISGPPGTCKTKTLAETALQVLINDTQCHILITAPSNSACDTLISRLIPFLGTQYLFRLNHPSRTFAEVPTAIMPYCYGELHFDLPPLDDLLKYRIVVCTCVDAGLLISAGASNQSLREYIPHKGTTDDEPLRSHWTHLLIDEAGQAIEPETDIPLLCVLDECQDPPQIVLCGDHNQLGPKTFLPELQLSFLERLATTVSIYCDHPQSRKFARSKATGVIANNSKETALLEKTIPAFANLVQNYRSHPKMLMMPSAMFYNNTLIASGEKRVINSMLGSALLPNPDCPIAFVGVNGTDTSHLGEAVSWRNELEADKVAEIIQRLLRPEIDEDDEIGFNVKVSDIGVIAPFREQVKHLRQVLRAKGFAGVNVGTVEDYQGQEYRVVLISTTRSRVKYLDQDVRQGLGLVHFRKRFNVALTRAQAMMVIVGNPELLVLDEYWADYLHFCLRNGAYTGCPLPDSILNTHTGNRENSTLIGRLEMNSFVSQFVDNLDRGRWLGGRTEIEEEGFIVVPTSSDSEDEDDEDENGEEDEDYQDEGQDDDGGEYAPDMSFRSERSGHGLVGQDDKEHGYGGDHGSNHVLNGGNEGEEEDEGVRNAMEKLALGSLNMDDDTPVLSYSKSHAPQNHRSGHQGSIASPQVHYGNKDHHQGHSTSNNSINIPNTGANWSYRNRHQAQAQIAPSPNMWPANTREFKRMSASKLVLERSFDPTEQDIFEEY